MGLGGADSGWGWGAEGVQLETGREMRLGLEIEMPKGGTGRRGGGGIGDEEGEGPEGSWDLDRLEFGMVLQQDGVEFGMALGSGVPPRGSLAGAMQGSPSGSSRRVSPRCCSAVRKALCRL